VINSSERLDLERRFGITGGNIFHAEMSLDQMFIMRPVAGWARYRTPVQGLFLCGSGAHPGRWSNGRAGLQLRPRDAAGSLTLGSNCCEPCDQLIGEGRLNLGRDQLCLVHVFYVYLILQTKAGQLHPHQVRERDQPDALELP
jgi:hypothetical protein